MPEVSMCIHCRRPIDEQVERYVVTNKETEQRRELWLYAHAACQIHKAARRS